MKYELPTSEVSLSRVFQTMNGAKGQLHVIDWGVANATLEVRLDIFNFRCQDAPP